MPSKAVFFDRDGVLNVDKSYLYKIEELEWVDGAKDAVKFLTELGYLIFVVTNQSGIARGYYSCDDMLKLHQYMTEEIIKSGGKIDAFYYCPHLPNGSVPEYAIECDCRKPKPGLLLKAMAEFAVDKEKSFLIGDKMRDVESAKAAGIKGYLFEQGNLLEFIKKLLIKEENLLNQ
ncbi:MAG TPA: HAD family hydrolase [Candidatus Avacidaminococcus intestinavium]|uniref:D,D-heptose 1,7-bisphosphate phosphatase n=1 Tax=Candidatus Avacidaminococcus intestinavium TaxID=2840684 RepID=A0A9D1MNF9_9FIRM|nr:HAD family hydrolase [Candidatus Avacidaminococcus intestinavium]